MSPRPLDRGERSAAQGARRVVAVLALAAAGLLSPAVRAGAPEPSAIPVQFLCGAPPVPLARLITMVSDEASAGAGQAERVVPPASDAADPADPDLPPAPPANPKRRAGSRGPQRPAASAVVNMEFRDTDLPVVLRGLCQGAGLDFVLRPDIQGKVTAKLRNTTWEKALEIILRSHGLVADRQGNTLVISRKKEKPQAESPKTKAVKVKRSADGKLDLDASGADIREALREVAAVAGLNVVASKDVSGQVTASLHGLSPEELLVALADSCGATLTERGSIIILSPRPITEPGKGPPTPSAQKPAIEVKKLEGGKLDVRASKGSVRDLLKELSAATGANIVASPDLKGTIDLALNGVTAQEVLAAIGAHSGVTFRPIGSMLYAAPVPAQVQAETFTLRYCEAKDVVKVLTEALPDAKVAVEEKTNAVVVAGEPAILAAARAIVQGLEKPPTQVTIEARLLETNLTGDERLGIDWNTSFTFNATFPTVPHTFPFSKNRTGSYFPGYDPSDSRSRGDRAVPYADTDDFKFGFLSASGLNVVLHTLQQRSHTRMIANPTVTTIENREAKINMATKYPVPNYQVSDETGVLTVSGFEYKEFGTILTVTPRVEGDYIILRVHPEVSRQSGTTTFQDAELPIITSQETDTEVRIKDGDTLVIAGLVREDSTKRRSGFPFFSKLPLIGSLFRSRENTLEARRNLIIFLTPHIVRDADFAEAAALKKKHTEPMPNSLEPKLDP